MSYISAEKHNDDVIVWERNNGVREAKTYPAPYYFYVKDQNGPFNSIYRDKLKRIDCATSRDFQQEKFKYSERFESDIPPELKILSEHYYGQDGPDLHVSFLDIEVDYDKEIGFSSVQNPYAPINSVAIYNNWENTYYVLAVPPNYAPSKPTSDDYVFGEAPEEFIAEMFNIAKFTSDAKIKVWFCRDEHDLLQRLMKIIDDSDVICGWNSDMFDVPYIAKRAEKYNKSLWRKLCFPGASDPRYRDVEIFGNTNVTVDIGGRISADYMALFKKYEMAGRPSYKLESIAEEILVDPETKEPTLPKLEYEGSLATLYRKNFAWFVRYNIRDTEILHGFENILGYVGVANQSMHLSTGLFKHATGTIKLAELATINYCHHVFGGLIVNDFQQDDSNDEGIQGAFVLMPQRGLHKNIGSIDITSLYPKSIIGINISPETLLGQFVDAVQAAEHIAQGSAVRLTLVFDNTTHVPKDIRGKQTTATASEWRDILWKNKWSISGYGTVFSQEKPGIIPTILADWFDRRNHYKKLMKEAKQAGDLEKANYYDKLQYVYKIKLNSFYGALSNVFFKFYDLRMGESTTGTGRQILLHQCAKACEILDGEYTLPDVVQDDPKREGRVHYGYSDKWSVVYGDTDSSYFVTHAETSAQAIKLADRVGELVNDSFTEFMQDRFRCQPGFDNTIQSAREIVSDRGIFVDKKRYILHIVDNEGYACDKMKVMGLDTKKTTLPKEVAKVLNGFVESLLKGKSWEEVAKEIVDYKEMLMNLPVHQIGLPKGVNKVEKYTLDYKMDEGCRLPGHVAASIHYNQCLEEYQDKESMKISTGMKIKVFYLRQKIGRWTSIALPVDIETIPEWFSKYDIDKDAQIQRLVDNPMDNIIKAIGKKTPSKQELFVDDLLGF